MNKSSRFYRIENCQQNLPFSIIAQIELSMLDVLLSFLRPLRQRIALLRSAKLIIVLIQFIVSEYDSFRFSGSFSASFWTVFVEPGAAPPGHRTFEKNGIYWKHDLTPLMYFDSTQLQGW